MRSVLRGIVLSFASLVRGDKDTALAIPVIRGELTTPQQIHQALQPAWKSLVEERNDAGLVDPKQEGKPQPPLEKEESAFQFDRVQKGHVDSARLLLVFGLIPSARHIDNETEKLLLRDRERASADESSSNASDDSSYSLTVIDPSMRYPDGSSPLHHAATFGVIESIRRFLDAGFDVNAVTRSGVQPIHASAIMGHSAAVELLAARRANINARHGFAHSTPLHFATEMGHPDVVRRLCELRADVEAAKKQGGTAIHISADTNNAAVTRALIEAPCNADPDAVLLGDTVPLYLAAGRGFPDVINVLIEAGANPDRTLWPQRPPKASKKVSSKQKQAAQSTELATVEGDPSHFLPGSSPNAPGWEEGNGATALHNACENGHLKAVTALLDGGARQLATMEGVTPLIISLQYRHPHIADALLDSSTPANVDVVNPKDGQSALHIASAYDYPDVVARILRQGGRVDTRDRRGALASDYARGQMSRWLLGRFSGREPRLDAVIRSSGDGDLVDRLMAAKDVPAKVRDRYVKYAKRHRDGTLPAEAARLAGVLSSTDVQESKREDFLRRFAIMRFMLAGGSDLPIAIEALMKETEPAAHAALALLGVKVTSLQYTPGKNFEVNGHDVLGLVKRIVEAAQSNVEKGDASDVERLVEELRSTVDGRRKPPREVSKQTEPADDDEEQWLEL